MKLSIITINYNNIEGLKKTVESVMSQTWRDFEWIIVDGGSTDGSKEVIEEVAKNPKANVSWWCSERDKGIYNALNKGIEHCNGEYISCMNSGDTYYDEKTLEKVWGNEHKGDILYGDWIKESAGNEQLMKADQEVDIYVLYKKNINHQAMFVKTRILRDEGFDESYKLCADHKRWVDAALNGNCFEHINLIISRYDGNGMSATQQEVVREELSRLEASYPPAVVGLIRRVDYMASGIMIQAKYIEDRKNILVRILRIIIRFFIKTVQ